MPKKTDAQVLRSKEWMLEALITLMSEKEFEQITVSEIAQRAGLDRRTFYRHFGSKEEILADYIQKLGALYEETLRKSRAMNTYSIVLAFFTVCEQNGELLNLLHRHRLLPLLLYELNSLFAQMHNKYHIGEDIYASFDQEYALSYHVGGFWNVLVIWLSNGMTKKPEELATMIGHMLPEFI